jgi:(2Fe-2S) ferredoxin
LGIFSVQNAASHAVTAPPHTIRYTQSTQENTRLAKFKHHVFICGNSREPGNPRGSCTTDGKSELMPLFQARVKEAGIKPTVRINKAGCLDQCEHGPTIAVYPEAIWYGFVTPADVDEIVQSHLVNGKPVERLVLPDTCINTATCPHKPRPSVAAPPAQEAVATPQV